MSRNGKKESAELDTSALPSLPKGWCWTTLATISDIEGGITKDQKRRTTPTMREVPYLRVANVQRGFLDLSEVKTILAEEEEIQSLLLQEGDVLFTEGGDRDKLGRGWVWKGEIPDCIHQNHIFRARLCRDVAEPKFVSYHGNHFGQSWFVRTGKQTTNLASINKSVLSRFPVPLAPVQEQCRIVAKIEELFSDLDAGVAALERVRANLKRYRTAVLKAAVEGRLTAEWRAQNPPKETGRQLLARILREHRRKWEEEQLVSFGKAGKMPPAKWKEKYNEPAGPDCTGLPALPEGWCWATVDQLIFYLRNGLSLKPSQTPPGHRILRINAVRPMAVNLQEIRYYDMPDAQVANFFIENGDLLFTRYNGSVDLLGVAGMVNGCSEPTLHPDKLIRVKAVLGHPLPAYLEIAANVGVSRRHMQGRARTTAGQTGISGVDIREMPIPLCSVAEQEQILEEVERRLSILQEADTQIEANFKRSARLRQSILKRAFEGKLVAQDPHDESASTLLAGISTQTKDGRAQLEERRPSRSSRKRSQAGEALSCRKSS